MDRVKGAVYDAGVLVSGFVVFLVLGLVVLAFLYAPILGLAVAGWIALFGTLGALVAPRKGMTPRVGFAIAGVFGIFGVAWIALKDDAPGRTS